MNVNEPNVDIHMQNKDTIEFVTEIDVKEPEAIEEQNVEGTTEAMKNKMLKRFFCFLIIFSGITS
jgi:hypothetical protein